MSEQLSIERLFNDFRNTNVLVVGDVMIDAYLCGKVDRVSPEAPVPVVDVQKRENRLGGAANVALNIQALGATPYLCSVIGNDLKGKEFVRLLDDAGLVSKHVLESSERITTTKFRILGNKMQMLRVDEEIKTNLSDADQNRLFADIQQVIANEKIDVILFQDYDKGVLSEKIIQKIIWLANENDIPTIVDPKKNNFLNYKGVSVFKPNLKELSEGMSQVIDIHNQEQIKQAVEKLNQLLRNEVTLITLSEEGVFIMDHVTNESKFIKAHKRAISDVSGAGDTVVSVASLCLANKVKNEELAAISNLAGGLVCETSGVTPINKKLLHSEIINKL